MSRRIQGAARAPGALKVDGVDFTPPRMHRLGARHGELRTILSRWEDPQFYGLKKLPRIANALSVWQAFGALLYTSIMAVDADGAPDAYGPAGTNPQQPFDRYGVVVDAGGTPVRQTSGFYRGYYLSGTSLVNPASLQAGDPAKYVDANKIPYFAVNAALTYADKGSYGSTNLPKNRVEVGDYGLVVNKRDHLYAHAIVAEIKYRTNGEGSVRLCEDLGLQADAVRGNDSGPNDIIYVVFPGSGDDFFPASDFNIDKTLKANDATSNASIAHITQEGLACYTNWIARITAETNRSLTLGSRSKPPLANLPLDIVQAVSNILFQAQSVRR